MFAYYLLTFVGFAGLLLNIIEVQLITSKLSFLRPFEQLLLSLACSDILTGAITIGYGCYALIADGNEREHALKLAIVVATFAFTAVNLIAIGADRYMAIRYPIKHRNCLTKKRVKIFIFLLWTVMIGFLVIAPGIAAIATGQESWPVAYFHWMASDWIVWSTIMMTTYYSMIIYITLRRRSKLNQQSITIEVRASKREICLIWTCVLSVCIYTVTSLPYAIYLKVTNKSSVYLVILLLSNLITNPVMYFGKIYRGRKNQVNVN